MSQRRYQHGFTAGQYLWLVSAVALGLALSTQVVGAKECHRETPLPADVRLIAPAPGVPDALARFAGAWTGEWEHSGGLCHTLVVEEVFANGYARVIFADALNMATGIGANWPHREPNQPFADVFKSPKYFRFIGARTAKQRLDAAFSFDKYPWGPGEVLRYNDINTLHPNRGDG